MSRFENCKTALLAFILVSATFLLQRNVFINLADEGFLWYGTWRASLGEVPLRDFTAYYPGRYYWGALWFKLFGDGVLALRASNAIFQFLGLTCGLLVLRRLSRQWRFLIPAGLVLLLWMHPLYKVFEMSIVMACLYFAVRLIENPTARRLFTTGVFVGLAACFGRHLGLYSFLVFLSLIMILRFRYDSETEGPRNIFKRIAIWSGGIIVGFSPILLMVLMVPGFFGAFLDGFMIFYRIKTTNITLPIPLPWNVFSHLYPQVNFSASWAARFILMCAGILYIVWLGFFVLTLLCVVFKKPRLTPPMTVLIASALVAAPCFHYAATRYDFDHIAMNIYPLLTGFLALSFVLEPYRKRITGAACRVVRGGVVLSAFPAILLSSGYLKPGAEAGALVQAQIGEDRLWVRKERAYLIERIRQLDRNCFDAEEGLLVAPHWPTIYPMLKRESPLHMIYFLFQETADRQRDMIAAIEAKNVNWAILGDVKLDGREDLRFRNTHRLLWEHIVNEFDPISISGFPDNYLLYHRRGKGHNISAFCATAINEGQTA
ncbi:MAG: hypothetical protein Q8R76_11635 [Candidatus Omnitrophota bacterium]|nr:hypothetical protein [Candidatus Omnitrophota bacterium]